MLKKMIALVVLLSMITFVIVQAMERQQDNNKEVTEETEDTKKTEELSGLTVGAKAPDFTLKSLEGEGVSLSDFKGRKVLVNFWATWCPPCKNEMPAIQQYSETASEDFVVLAINVNSEKDAIAFANNNHLTFTILYDDQEADYPVSDLYQVMTLPTTYFIDSKGNIQNKIIGEMKLKDIEENMKLLQ